MTKPKYFNDERAAKAQAHIQEMNKKYSEEILEIVSESTIYMKPLKSKTNKATTNIIVDNIDSVSAIYKHFKGKTAVLNFASFHNRVVDLLWEVWHKKKLFVVNLFYTTFYLIINLRAITKIMVKKSLIINLLIEEFTLLV